MKNKFVFTIEPRIELGKVEIRVCNIGKTHHCFRCGDWIDLKDENKATDWYIGFEHRNIGTTYIWTWLCPSCYDIANQDEYDVNNVWLSMIKKELIDCNDGLFLIEQLVRPRRFEWHVEG